MGFLKRNQNPPKNKRRTWLVIITLCATLTIIFLTTLPIVLQRAAEAWLEKNGAQQATVGNIDLNIFTGRLGVFDVKIEKAGEVPLRIWRLTADFDWWPLGRKRLFINEVWLYELDVDIRQTDDGRIEIGGISLVGDTQTQAQSEEDAGAGSENFLQRWGIGLGSFAIKNSNIRYRSALFDEQISIKHFFLSNVFSWQPEQAARINFDLLVNDEPVTLLSNTRVFRETPDTRSTLKISDLDLSRYKAVVKQAGIEELRGTLSMALVFDAVYESDKRAHFNLDIDASLNDFLLRQGNFQLQHNRLNHQSKAKVVFPAVAEQPLLTTEGVLQIQDQIINSGNLRASYSDMLWRGSAEVRVADAKTLPTVYGNLQVENVQVSDPAADLKLAALKGLRVKDIVLNLPNSIRVGEIAIEKLQALQQSAAEVQPMLPEIALNNALLTELLFDQEKQIASMAAGKLTGLSAQTNDKKLQLAQVEELNLEAVKVHLQEEASVKTLSLSNAHALNATATSASIEPIVSITNIKLDTLHFRFTPQVLDLGLVDIDGVNVSLRREANGSLYPLHLLPVDSEHAEPTATAATIAATANTTPAKAFKFKLGEFRISANSKIRIVDQSVQPHFFAEINPIQLTVEQIDNENIDSKTTFKLNSSVAAGNTITANGWVTPFALRRDADIKANIQALDLVMFSPYFVDAVAYEVRSGRIDVKFGGKINKDSVTADSKLVAKRLNLDATGGIASGEFAKGLGIPLDAALAMMKDKNGDITIEVPVSGNLQDPNFAFTRAFRRAMFEAIKKASITYAAYALQPYGSILLGAKLLGKATALRLQSVRFAPGKSDLDETAKNYLDKIAVLMKDRPGINITLCGNATPRDRSNLENAAADDAGLTPETRVLIEQALSQLADERGDNVEEYFISQHGIGADRFFDCQPTVTSSPIAEPEVHLGL